MRTGWAAAVWCAAGLAAAQEPAYMDAATHPAQGQSYVRVLGYAAEYDDPGPETRRQSMGLKLAHGLRSSTALVVESEWARREGGGETDSGFVRAGLLLKQRFLRRDLGPLDTWRASVLAGADLPGDEMVREAAHVSPRLGVATTAILGRHGLNGQIDWTGRTGEDDRFRLNGSYLYRLAPATYAVDSRGAWYAVAEWLNEVTTGGDLRSDAVTGLLYEARNWAAEVGLRLPLAQDGLPELRQEVVV
ncbi:MAG TPA: hypothetical protein PLK81_08575, partial [Kiritimatiellia bacterium]|nr:hypothetical protein [Kiritimatiellia bacterium]